MAPWVDAITVGFQHEGRVMANPYSPPTQSGGAATPVVGENSAYEFDNQENQVIDKIGRRARLWGIISYIGAALMTVAILFLMFGASLMTTLTSGALGHVLAAAVGGAALYMILVAVTYAAMGKLYTDAGASLQRVVVSTDDDVQHMMQALARLGTAFQIEAVLVVLAILLTAATSLLGFDLQLPGM